MSKDPNVTAPYFSKDVRFIPDAFAMIYDLEAFSRFANQPDAARYVPRVLNIVTSIISDTIRGGSVWWESTARDWPKIDGLLQRKFLGDGELLLFENPPEPNVTAFLNRFYNVQNNYTKIRARFEEEAPLAILPTGIRFGIARGSLYELPSQEGDGREYIGICINLASRLQSYCPSLKFIASARAEMRKQHLEEFSWQKVYAINIKGFAPEVVLISQDHLAQLPSEIRSKYFSETRPEDV
jgi:class 3 adenylate cyclase